MIFPFERQILTALSLATAAATLPVAAGMVRTAFVMEAAEVHCYGVNACKSANSKGGKGGL